MKLADRKDFITKRMKLSRVASQKLQIENCKPKINNMLRITEIFRSIQGESTHAGRPCSFVRLTGCPMRCRWCDSEYTFTGGEKMTLDAVMQQVRAFDVKLVEVTGGEPLAQKAVYPLITQLCDEGFEVLIETGGYLSTENVDDRASIILDVKCPASGEAKRNYWANLERLRPEKDEIKFVIANFDDLEFAQNVIERFDLSNRAKALLISPVFGAENLVDFANWTASCGYQNARLQLQLHKYIWGRDVHGV